MTRIAYRLALGLLLFAASLPSFAQAWPSSHSSRHSASS